MYYSWKYYTSGVKNTAIKSESKMLSFPTQVNKKGTKKKSKSSYFVISSDAAYKEMLSEKEEKEKKKAETENRKRAREELRKQKELQKQIKQTQKKMKRERAK